MVECKSALVSISVLPSFIALYQHAKWFYFCLSPQVLCFKTLRRHTHTHARTTWGSSLLTAQTSKPAVPRGTSNTGEAIKRQKLFSVRSWFIWLKNETTNPTGNIFPSQGLLYQADAKLLPGGIPLKGKWLNLKSQSFLVRSCRPASPLTPYLIFFPLPFSFSFSIFFTLTFLYEQATINAHTQCVSLKLSCLAKHSLAAIRHWRKDKRGGDGLRWVCLREARR